MPRLRELSRHRKTNYVTTNLHRVKKKQESNWQRRVEEGKESGKIMEHSTAKTEMVKTVERKRVASTKAAALGGWRGSDWERKEKTHLGAMAAGAEGAGVAGKGPLQGERESEVDLRLFWWLVFGLRMKGQSVWFEDEGGEKVSIKLG